MKPATIQKLKDALNEIRDQYHHRIAEEIRSSLDSYAVIGRRYGVSEQTVYTIARLNGLCRTKKIGNEESGQ